MQTNLPSHNHPHDKREPMEKLRIFETANPRYPQVLHISVLFLDFGRVIHRETPCVVLRGRLIPLGLRVMVLPFVPANIWYFHIECLTRIASRLVPGNSSGDVRLVGRWIRM